MAVHFMPAVFLAEIEHTIYSGRLIHDKHESISLLQASAFLYLKNISECLLAD